MAGQSDALALAQSILENKRREAEKLRRNRLVLEEDEKAIEEQIRKAEQLVASLGGASVGAPVDGEFLSPPPGFESWAANRGRPPKHRKMAGGRLWPRHHEGERDVSDSRGASRGADGRRGRRQDKGAVPCVLWLGYPPNGAVKGDAELKEMCERAAGGEGHVVSMVTKPSFTKGNPCQYIEMSSPAAATAALEHLRRVLPNFILVQYSRSQKAMGVATSAPPTPPTRFSPRLNHDQPPEVSRTEAAEEESARPTTRSRSREEESVEDGERPKKRAKEARADPVVEDQPQRGMKEGRSSGEKENVSNGERKTGLAEGDTKEGSGRRRGRSADKANGTESEEQRAERKKKKEERRKRKEEERLTAEKTQRKNQERKKKREDKERIQDAVNETASKGKKVKNTGSQAEIEKAATLQREKSEREKKEKKERRRQEKARAAEEAAAGAQEKQRKKEKRAARKAEKAKARAEGTRAGKEGGAEQNRMVVRDRAQEQREAPRGEEEQLETRQLAAASPAARRGATRDGASTSRASADLVSQVWKRAEVPIPGRASVEYVPPLHKIKMRDIKWSVKDGNIFLVNQHNGKLAPWTVINNGWTVREGRAVEVLNSVNKWVEDFVSFDPERVAVVYTQAPKKDAGGPGEQLGMVDLQSGRIAFAKETPHARGASCVTALPGSPSAARLVTGGLHHEVFSWVVEERGIGPAFKPTLLHSQHSSSVSGLELLCHRPVLLSAGLDGRAISYDLERQLAYELVTRRPKMPLYRILQNPVDPNLLLFQTGNVGVQYELRDLRAPEQVLSSFGWTPKVKHAQGPGTVGTWSPGGVLIASGATDPEIHLFDIRKKCSAPLVSLRTEQKTKKSLWYRGGSVLVSSCAERNSICVSRLNL